jgi:hypothetical protein
MIRPRLRMQQTGRANEPALPGLQQCPEAPSRINHIARVAVVLATGTVLLDPWVHSTTSLAHHTRPPPQTIADPINERSRPNVTMCCSHVCTVLRYLQRLVGHVHCCLPSVSTACEKAATRERHLADRILHRSPLLYIQ